MIKIPLRGKAEGQVALVDDRFSELLNYNWYVNSRGYVTRNAPREGRKVQSKVMLHHVVMGKPESGFVTDHINHSKLDNRVDNLRHCTESQNQHNKSVSKSSKTGLKGVFLSGSKFRSAIWLNGKSVKLGTFNTPEQAHRAYLEKARQSFGEYAYA